jgi:tetratricopeptide (TPR) repeat protein
MWIVFSIDEEGNFHDINKLAPLEYIDSNDQLASKHMRVLNAYLKESHYAPIIASTTKDIDQAQRLNKQGENAYHASRIDDAIDYYRQAIDIDPYYGQAYSNLGLAFQKAGRVAEAIWANRRAISLAAGDTANVVRASSYYNIARIYERGGQFADALRQYELANQEKPSSVYSEAIMRLRTKLK